MLYFRLLFFASVLPDGLHQAESVEKRSAQKKCQHEIVAPAAAGGGEAEQGVKPQTEEKERCCDGEDIESVFVQRMLWIPEIPREPACPKSIAPLFFIIPQKALKRRPS